MRSLRGAGRLALVVLPPLVVSACATHDPAKELEIRGIETYWIVDSPNGGQNYISPVVRFWLRNRGHEPLRAIQARARFPAPNQDEVWGSIQEQVSTWQKPLEPAQERQVTIRSAGRYHAAADPEDMLRSPGFRDPRVEIFVRIGASSWALLGEASVERRIGAPELRGLVGP
jgi:hypothetical protein